MSLLDTDVLVALAGDARHLLSDAIRTALSNQSLRAFFGRFILRFSVLSFLCLIFNPSIRAVARHQLSRSFGMTFEDLRVLPWKIKIFLTNIELLPSKSSLLRTIIVAILPSANIKEVANSVDYPESRVTVDKLSIKLRIQSPVAISPKGIDPDLTPNLAPEHSQIEDGIRIVQYGLSFFPHLLVIVKLEGVKIEIEKTYLAPDPPEHYRRLSQDMGQPLPVAIPFSSASSDDIGDADELPTFCQDMYLDGIENEDILDANNITWLVDKWIEHAKTKSIPSKKKSQKGVTFRMSSSHASSKQGRDGGEDASNANANEDDGTTETLTSDEKLNAWIHWVADIVLHLVSFEVQNASFIISGAGSEIVKRARDENTPIQSNLLLARLPRHKRALTVISAEALKLSFSPKHGNALLACVGVHLKVGDPVEAEADARGSTNLAYKFETISHPFNSVVELSGVVDLLAWFTSYDHYWHSRTIALHITSSEVAVNLSPRSLHTVLHHIDDYIDPLGSFPEWYEWLRLMNSNRKSVTDQEKLDYRSSWAKWRKVEINDQDITPSPQALTQDQMRDIERRMTRYEIMSQRCYAMRNGWAFSESEEFDQFLRYTRSSILLEDSAISPTPSDALSSFERIYPTKQHALANLMREESTVMAAQICVKTDFDVLYIDYPHNRGHSGMQKSYEPSIPTTMIVHGMSFEFNQKTADILFSKSKISMDLTAPRSFLDLSLRVNGVRWDVVSKTTNLKGEELPTFRNRTPVGIIYMDREPISSKQVLSISLAMAVTPTQVSESKFDVSVQTSDLVIVLNPLPILSALQILLEATDIPFQSANQDDLSGVSVPPASPNVTPLDTKSKILVAVDNISTLLLIDRKKTTRGMLGLTVDGVSISMDTGNLEGSLNIASESIALKAGQICYHQPSPEFLSWELMPFKPTAKIERASVVAHCQEETVSKSGTPMAFAPKQTVVHFDVEMSTGAASFNASPSTIASVSGVLSSFDAFMKWTEVDTATVEAEQLKEEQARKEILEQRSLHTQKILVDIFKEIDIDGSGQLNEEELQTVVTKLFNANHNIDLERRINIAQMLTESELQRESTHLIKVIDPTRSEEVTFQELDNAFLRLANKIDDNNLDTLNGEGWGKQWHNQSFVNTDSFLSGSSLRKLIYYDDIREYAAMHQVYRITGFEGIGNETSFPNPNMWRQGKGVEIFWRFYEKETGCSRDSLNGQSISIVQFKLVRSLCNYAFAKYAWMSVVQPQLVLASDGRDATHWMIESNTNAKITKGVIEMLMRHIQTEVKKENSAGRKFVQDVHFDVSVRATVRRAVLMYGSSHTFTNPLVEVKFTDVAVNALALLSSKTKWFVPTREVNLAPVNTMQDIENSGGNGITFQSTVSAEYLNTRHDHMEQFIESYPCFGGLTYQVFLEQTSSASRDEEESEASSFTFHADCPRFLNINTSRSFFETASCLKKNLDQSDPIKFRALLSDRDLEYISSYWNLKDKKRTGSLDRTSAFLILEKITDIHFRDITSGLALSEKRHFINTFCDLADRDGDGNMSLEDVLWAFKTFTSRCYFSGSNDILIKNDSGRVLHCLLSDKPMRDLPEGAMENVIDSFYTVTKGGKSALPLRVNAESGELDGKFVFYVPGFKLVDNISVSPYQSIMIPLKYSKRGSKRRKRHTSASGFAPYLTIVPESDSMDSITLNVRTCVSISSEIPVRIRVVRLGKTAGKFRKKGTKNKMDLTKSKALLVALKRIVEGSPVVFERSDIEPGTPVPLPLDVLNSTHFHVLLIQPISEHGNTNSWRDPVLLTKEYLYNTENLRDVTRNHTRSGIVVTKDRLNSHLTRRKNQRPQGPGNFNRQILLRTAWDTNINIVPFFMLTNSLPFPIRVRTWQTTEQEEEDMTWAMEQSQLAQSSDNNNMGEDSSDDEDDYTMMSRIPDVVHLSEVGQKDHYSDDEIGSGETRNFSGVSLQEPIYLQIAQVVKSPVNSREVSFLWSSPMSIRLEKMKTGMNERGSKRLPKSVLDLGDNCDCVVDVSVESKTKIPSCTVYSPYWVMNKTGTKLEYKVAGQTKRYLDSGLGGLPLMIHGSKSEATNDKYKRNAKEISIIPVESPSKKLADLWWDSSTNGELVVKKGSIKVNGRDLVGWSDPIDMDGVGVNGEVWCDSYVFNAKIVSLAGAFHRCNMINITPRFVVKNTLHMPISLVPLEGGGHEVLHKAAQFRKLIDPSNESAIINLKPGESTPLYQFFDVTSGGMENPYRWVAFRVNAARFGPTFKPKWHVIPCDDKETHMFGEHDGCFDTMVSIIAAKVHESDFGSTLISISHSTVPPFRIENRSNDHYLRFVQDDDQAVVFELAPMNSCAYTWDNPMGKKKLRVTVIPKSESRERMLEEAVNEREEAASTVVSVATNDCDESTTSDDAADGIHPLLQTTNDPAEAQEKIRALNKTTPYRTRRRRALHSRNARVYNLRRIGRNRDLPCPSPKDPEMKNMTMKSHLVSHSRIVAGTKILSFSDSTWIADQVEAGLMRKGGDFKRAVCKINIQGVGLYIMDDFPRETLGVVVRDIQIIKPTGSIETTFRVRHFQVDAMLPNARYPIIIRPLPLGVDRRDDGSSGPSAANLIIPQSVPVKECFWKMNEEKPIPVFEIAASYVPQENMTWVPSCRVDISPLKIQVDVDYLLRIMGMVISSVSKYQSENKHAGNLNAAEKANEPLQYVTRGQLNILMTYIEKLHISPVYLDFELNIKADDQVGSDAEFDSNLTLHSIAQSTDSAALSGVLSWVISVGSNFAHVSPRFEFGGMTYSDKYCDFIDMIYEIVISYIIQLVKQAYKVVFSMQLLGDPSALVHQWKTGVRDLFVKTREEIAAGGKDGIGKGVTSAVHNIFGGTLHAFGRLTGGIADTIDSITTNETTSNHLKPKSASSNGKYPEHAGDGIVQGADYFAKTMVHGFAGLIGNPYRGAASGSVTGFAKGVVSGVTGFATSPFVGALGFTAKVADGLGSTTKYLDLGVIEARCRPSRSVPWGRPMSPNGLSYIKAVGVRIHTVRYQKVRRRIKAADPDGESVDQSEFTSREYKKIAYAEERRKNPPLKALSLVHDKDKYHHITKPIKPKLLTDMPGAAVLSHYAVTFEETLILRSSDLQLGDEVKIYFWNYRGLKSSTTRAKPLAVCRLSVGDMYSSMLRHFNEVLLRQDRILSSAMNDPEFFADNEDLITPAIQECPMFRPVKKSVNNNDNIFSAINEEMAAIQQSEQDTMRIFDSDSEDSDSDDSFLHENGKEKKVEDIASLVKVNERLFGNVSLSYFPIPW